MVDRNKLKQGATGESPSVGTSAEADLGIEDNLKTIADIPAVGSSGEGARAWFVRLVVSIFAIVALFVLY